MVKNIQEYIPDIALIKKLEKVFDGDLNTQVFNADADLKVYLCALAYGAIGKELFYDEQVNGKIDLDDLHKPTFMQGMLTYSVIQKINKAERILQSFEFADSHQIDFSKEDQENDYATMAFVMYYMATKGYDVQWEKMSHAYSPINVSNGAVQFKKGEKISAKELIEYVETDLVLQQGNNI